LIKEDFIVSPNLRLKQDYSRYTMTSDTLHLAQFMKVKKKDDVLDIGTNNGVLALIAQTYTQNPVVGIDIDDLAIALAKENAAINHLSSAFLTIRVQDYKPDQAFDVIVCNPPYFISQNKLQNVMDFDSTLNLEDLAISSFRLLKDKGRLYIILKTHRLIEAITLFTKYRLTCKKMQMIHHNADRQASSVCVELIKNGKNHLVIEAPILNLKEI
jgi:tRNA1(Val) A37 N6-methylase TrmN6